jgi:hypothetical protein
VSNAGLFAIGSAVTLLVAASISLLVWGAILDGRDNDQRAAEHAAPVAPRAGQALHTVDAA